MRKSVVVAATVGLVIIGSSVAYAGIPDSKTGVITACRNSKGAVRVIDFQGGKRCVKGEAYLKWNSKGAAGPRGAAGVAGATGPQGIQGPIGPAGTPTPSIWEKVSVKVSGSMTTGPATLTAMAICPEGTRVTGGGYDIYSSFGDPLPEITRNSIGGERIWTVQIHNSFTGYGNYGVTASAICTGYTP